MQTTASPLVGLMPSTLTALRTAFLQPLFALGATRYTAETTAALAGRIGGRAAAADFIGLDLLSGTRAVLTSGGPVTQHVLNAYTHASSAAGRSAVALWRSTAIRSMH